MGAPGCGANVVHQLVERGLDRGSVDGDVPRVVDRRRSPRGLRTPVDDDDAVAGDAEVAYLQVAVQEGGVEVRERFGQGSGGLEDVKHRVGHVVRHHVGEPLPAMQDEPWHLVVGAVRGGRRGRQEPEEVGERAQVVDGWTGERAVEGRGGPEQLPALGPGDEDAVGQQRGADVAHDDRASVRRRRHADDRGVDGGRHAIEDAGSPEPGDAARVVRGLHDPVEAGVDVLQHEPGAVGEGHALERRPRLPVTVKRVT